MPLDNQEIHIMRPTFDLEANIRYREIRLKYGSFWHLGYSMTLEEIRRKPIWPRLVHAFAGGLKMDIPVVPFPLSMALFGTCHLQTS